MIQAVSRKLREIIAFNTKNALDIDKIDMSTSLKDIGINSISYIKIIVEIESEYGFEFSDDDLDFESKKSISFGDFVNHIIKEIEENDI